MQLGRTNVIPRASLPDAIVRCSIGALQVEDQILNESALRFCVDDLEGMLISKNTITHTQTCKLPVVICTRVSR